MDQGKHSIDCRTLGPAWKEPLKEFLKALEKAGDHRHFHPHPFTDEVIDGLARHRGRDLYTVVVEENRVLGYGMLRGWDEGFETPSLGIAIHPAARNLGLGKALMQFLHATARERGAKQVRLRVGGDNTAAMALYSALGYRFVSREGPYLVALLSLERARPGRGGR